MIRLISLIFGALVIICVAAAQSSEDYSSRITAIANTGLLTLICYFAAAILEHKKTVDK